jgi:hypothetical protein
LFPRRRRYALSVASLLFLPCLCRVEELSASATAGVIEQPSFHNPDIAPTDSVQPGFSVITDRYTTKSAFDAPPLAIAGAGSVKMT